MGRVRSLQIASTFLLLTQLTLISSSAQTTFIRSLSTPNDETPNKDIDVTRSRENTFLPTPPEESKISSAAGWSPVPVALTSKDHKRLGLLDRAYLDAFTILNNENQCSQLFGGRFAISALNELVLQLKPRYLDKNIAIRMSGKITTFQNNRTGFSFRLFEKAEINLSSSFFRSSEHFFVVSNLQPNTRETRVVVLLHELGHLVKSPENRWVLPDDGKDSSLSLENTRQVISVCREQIESLSKLGTEQQLASALSGTNP